MASRIGRSGRVAMEAVPTDWQRLGAMAHSSIASRLESDLEVLESLLSRRDASAVAEVQRIVAIANRFGTTAQAARANVALGWCAFYAADSELARQSHAAAVDLFDRAGDLEGKASAQYGLAAVSIRAQDADAVALVQAALETSRSAGDLRVEARALNGLGILYADSAADFDEAERAYSRALALFEQLGDKVWAGTVAANRARRRIHLFDAHTHPPSDDVALDEDVVAETMMIAKDMQALDDPAALGVADYARALAIHTLLRLGEFERAATELQDPRLWDSRLNSETRFLVWDAQARVLADHDADGSLAAIQRAEQIARRAQSRGAITAALRTKVEILEALGRFEDALQAHRQLLEAELRWSGDPTATAAAGARGHIRAQLARADIGELTQRAERMESLAAERANWVSAVSHELRTPITAILGLATELSERWDQLAEEAPLLVETIQFEAQDLAQIIDDLLAEARLSQGGMNVIPETFDARGLVEGVVATVARDFRVSVEGEGGHAHADPTRVRQVVRNLLTNADRYGGDTVRVVVEPGAESVVISVCDSGPGIPEADRATIFEPYGRASGSRKVGKSVGLGLSVSRDLARVMGGDLTYSHVDGWSVFALTLPAGVS
jgi:signal transduction histidine kinase